LKIDVLILPTAGWDNENGKPTVSGLHRIEKAVHMVSHGETKAVLVLGGKRDSGKSEAEMYIEYIKKNYLASIVENTIWDWDASATCTQRDIVEGEWKLVNLLQKLEVYAPLFGHFVVGLDSYPGHAKRATKALQRKPGQEIVIVDSGKKCMYSPRTEAMLDNITDRDPKWEHFPATVFVWLANRSRKLTIPELPS
jgi:hypothetical protein